jgi:hypothetical protein
MPSRRRLRHTSLTRRTSVEGLMSMLPGNFRFEIGAKGIVGPKMAFFPEAPSLMTALLTISSIW